MTRFEALSLLLSFTALILIPIAILVIRIIIKLTKAEDKLTQVVEAVEQLIEDKEKVHVEMYRQMRDDREATNKRLRWLEEHLWNRRAN